MGIVSIALLAYVSSSQERRDEVFRSGEGVMTHGHVGRRHSRLRCCNASFDRQRDESRVRPQPLREPRFVLDTHLGKLAEYLRLLGFDTLYRNDYAGTTLRSHLDLERPATSVRRAAS